MGIIVNGSILSLTSNTTTTSGTMTAPSASQVAIGDLLVLTLLSRNHTNVSPLMTVTDNSGDGVSWTNTYVNTSDNKCWIWHKYATTSAKWGTTISIANAINSLAGTGIWLSGAKQSGAITNIVTESNSAADESHAAFTPDFGRSLVCMGLYNVADDLVPSGMAWSNIGNLAAVQYIQGTHASTGGTDCSVNLSAAVQVGGPASTGTFTWAQTDNTVRTISFAVAPTDDEVWVAGGGVI
jgi:hypothetical protein